MNNFISHQQNRKVIFYLILLILALSFIIRPAIDPKAIKILRLQPMEYTAIEQSSWFLSLGAGLITLFIAVILKRRKQKHTSWMWAGLLFVIFALEEISWGGRFLRFPYLLIFGETVDGIHDIPFLIRKTLFSKFPFSQKLIFAFFAAFVIVLLMLWKKDFTKKFFKTISGSLPAKMIFLGCTLLLISQIIDIQVIPNPVWAKAGLSFLPPTYVEEFAECLASVCFLFAGIEKMIELRLAAQAEPVLATEKETII
jgi:hypothetical protein